MATKTEKPAEVEAPVPPTDEVAPDAGEAEVVEMTVEDVLLAMLPELPRRDNAASGGKDWLYPASNTLDIKSSAVQEFAYQVKLHCATDILAMNFGGSGESVITAHPNGRKFPVLADRAFHSPEQLRSAAAAWVKAHPGLVAPWVGSRRAA